MNAAIRESAHADIERIYAHIVADGRPRTAATVVERLIAAIERLGLFPRIGHEGREPGTFEWVVRSLPYIIVYEIDVLADLLTVLAVYDGRQNR